MSLKDDETAMRMFVESSLEHLERIEESILRIEELGDAAPDELILKVFRAAHSIKGDSACLELNNIRELAHNIENVLQLMRDRNIRFEKGLTTILLRTFDILANLIRDVRSSDRQDIRSHLLVLSTLYQNSIERHRK